MINVPMDKTLNKLFNINSGLYADFISGISGQDIITQSSAYELCGAIVIKTLSWDKKSIVWYICDINNSDMNSAMSIIKNCKAENDDIIMIYAYELKGEYCLLFSNLGIEYSDNDVIKLSQKQKDDVINLTNVEDDGDVFNKPISKNILYDFINLENSKTKQMLGIYKNNALVGAITIEKSNSLDVIMVKELFVAKKSRGNGYASRLLKHALGLYPAYIYSYSCGSDNQPSIATAKSCGFKFEGTYNFI